MYIFLYIGYIVIYSKGHKTREYKNHKAKEFKIHDNFH